MCLLSSTSGETLYILSYRPTEWAPTATTVGPVSSPFLSGFFMLLSFFLFGVASPLGGRPILTPALCLIFSGERSASDSASYGTCVMTAALFWDPQFLRLIKVMVVKALLTEEISDSDGCSPVKKAQAMTMVTPVVWMRSRDCLDEALRSSEPWWNRWVRRQHNSASSGETIGGLRFLRWCMPAGSWLVSRWHVYFVGLKRGRLFLLGATRGERRGSALWFGLCPVWSVCSWAFFCVVFFYGLRPFNINL